MNVGFDNHVPWWKVVAILIPRTRAAKRYIERAEKEGRLVDLTYGRRRRGMVVMETNQVFLSAVSPETLMARLEAIYQQHQKEKQL